MAISLQPTFNSATAQNIVPTQTYYVMNTYGRRVAVIGTGTLGLTAIKNLLEDGFDVTAFETRSYVGGLWKDSGDSTISVLGTTVFNSSKFRSAFSDLPFPEDVDDYPTGEQIHQYLELYADTFGLRKHIRLSTRVKQILRENDEWLLEVEDSISKRSETVTFDRVCVATGGFYKPRFPKLEGLENFQGRVLHSIDFHDPEEFRGQNVLIIGMHATAQDMVNSLSRSAKHVYLSHRHGILLLTRYTEDGSPLDTMQKIPLVMLQTWAEANIPALWTWIFDKALNKLSSKAYPNLPTEWGLLPAPSLAVSTPLIADMLYPFLKAGFAEPVTEVQRITGPKTALLTNGRSLSDIDSIIYCTGYDFDIPENLVPRPVNSKSRDLSYHPYPDGIGHPPRLYRNMYPLSTDESVRNTLVFLGQGALPLAGFLQWELAAMSISQTWLGKNALPPLSEMKAWHRNNLSRMAGLAKKYSVKANTTFYAIVMSMAEHLTYLDRTAGTGIYANFGGKFNGLFNWKCWKLWWGDRELYDLCTKGLLTSAIFRVFETGGRKAMEREEVKNRLRRDNQVFERAVGARRKAVGLDENGQKKTA